MPRSLPRIVVHPPAPMSEPAVLGHSNAASPAMVTHQNNVYLAYCASYTHKVTVIFSDAKTWSPPITRAWTSLSAPRWGYRVATASTV